jgi:hypothetical protein
MASRALELPLLFIVGGEISQDRRTRGPPAAANRRFLIRNARRDGETAGARQANDIR